jgi:hypothetical protein
MFAFDAGSCDGTLLCTLPRANRPTTLTFLPLNRANRAPNTCPTFINLQEAPRRRREEPSRSNFSAFCNGNRVVNIDAQIADGILDV